jgi:predicted nucleic acid-binding protein
MKGRDLFPKLLSPRRGEELLRQTLSRNHWGANQILRLEVAAAIARRVRAEKDPLPAEEAVRRYKKWLGLLDQSVITLIPESELLDQAVKLAVEIKHSLQDCMYLAAAAGLDAPLVTADEPFHKRATRFYKRISLLQGCSSN